jgi:hypothetical protein
MPPSNPAAGNQLAMPARGLVELARMHLADGVAPGGVRLLSADSARLMRAPQVEVPATVGGSVRQGLGWRLSSRVVEHGGDAPGNGALLLLVPDRQVAIAVLVNGGDMYGLIRELCDGLLDELAGLASPPAPEVRPENAVDVDADRYCGRYQLRNQAARVTVDGSGRLWLTQEDRNEAVTMAALAGVDAESSVTELRSIDGDLFRRLDQEGGSAGVVEFIGTDASGWARFLHTGRAAPRVD